MGHLRDQDTLGGAPDSDPKPQASLDEASGYVFNLCDLMEDLL
ncbi:MAG TPA: hypothetical protein VK579_06225 [Terriglobales bacterium]|nr:hypothetical protein [Terriglobales bacterium]